VLRRQRVRRTRSGSIKLDIPSQEQEILRHVLPQLRDLLTLGSADDRTRRLYPTAYSDDPEAEAEYVGYMRGELVASRLAALEVIESTIGERELTEEQAVAWLQSINSVRLVLGSLLDVSEELDVNALPDDDPEIEGYVLYGYLSMLLDELVTALSR
jgi:hypothetical protein